MNIQTSLPDSDVFQPQHVMALSTPLWVFDIDHARVIWANEAAIALWHADSREELYARDMGADMSQSIEDRLKQYQTDFIETDAGFNELWTLYPNGEPHTYRVFLRGHPLPDGRMAMRCEAVSEEHQQPDRLRSSEALNHISVAITLFSYDQQVLYSNSAAHQIYGSSSFPLLRRFAKPCDLSALLAEMESQGSACKICQVVTTSGQRWHEISARPCRDAINGQASFVLSEVDVTELKDQEQKVRYLAHHDTLTGLHNRNFINLAFPELLNKAVSLNQKLAMLLIDLDNFKIVNDTLGHDSGDQLLMHVARCLTEQKGQKASLARLGGDEFLMLVPFQDIAEIDDLCQRLLAKLTDDFVFNGVVLNGRGSFGVSLFPDHGQDLSTLMKHADLALYEAKDQGRNTYCYYCPAMQQAAILQRALERDLRQALQNCQFELHYQPRVDCHSQKVLSVEALMRWQHPERGMVSPNEFIPILEESGLIHEVGDWIVARAGTDQRRLAAAGFDIPISINISPAQFDRQDFVERLVRNLEQTGCPADRIEIEITEGMLMGDGFDAKATLMALRKRGFSIAVDDFGTGYSNLAYIQDYPISSLKVDRSFMDMIEDQSSVVNLILSLCRLIGVSSVAEGVETADQLAWLKLNHCHQYQGYLYSRPIALDGLLTLLRHPPAIAQPLVEVGLEEADIAWM